MANSPKDLLTANEDWVAKIQQSNPELIESISKGQKPTFLWIGCADSRVPAEVITEALPGSIFVQRNVANMVVHTDYSLLSVINYAVKALKVQHIIVCGHYGCGGVQAAMGKSSLGLLDNWVSHIRDVYHKNKNEINSISDDKERWDKFVDINVREQVDNVSKLSFIQEEWKNGDLPHIHGWVFDISTGKLKDLGISRNSADAIDEIYRYQ